MSTLVYPVLPGIGWSVIRRPTFDTTVRATKSLREVRFQNITETLMEFELTYEYLSQSDLTNLMGFYLRMRGGYDTFLFDDPEDDSVTNVQIGTGDGSTKVFTCQRSLGASTRVVDYLNAVSAVYVGGVLQSSGYSVTLPNQITFTTAPASGAAVNATFTYYWKCRFIDDSMDFEEFMQYMHTVKSVKFRSTRQ